MTASVARLHAGDGYTYLTRQVAAGDHERGRGESLSDYYTADGCPPGRWYGSGLDALGVTGTVTEDQMKALFGEGLHPNAEALIAERLPVERAALGIDKLPANKVAAAQQKAYARAEQAARLGRRFPHFDTSREAAWQAAVDQAAATIRDREGVDSEADLSREQRAEVRTMAGDMLFTRENLRAPANDAELEAYIVKRARPTPQPVSGYDITFTPVKSVSVMWGLGDEDTRKAIEEAHAEAVDKALAYIEEEVLFTRTGAAGVAQHEAAGLIAARFDHFDSRTGDPNLHTHVAIPNRVQGPDGKWRSIDGRVIFAANVSYSEVYNTALEAGVSRRLEVAFADRDMGEGKRPVREIAGIDPRLADAFATRRGAIEQAYAELAAQYRRDHGHEPSRAVRFELAQQATLDTRTAKGPVESLATKRERWRRIAVDVSDEASIDSLLTIAREHARPVARDPMVDGDGRFIGIEAAADRVLQRVAQDRATWRLWHVRAEAHRQLRGLRDLSPDDREQLIDEVSEVALDRSVLCEPPEPELEDIPEDLARPNGELVFRQHGGQRFTSWDVLADEGKLVDAARTPVPAPLTPDIVDAVLSHHQEAAREGRGHELDQAQQELVRSFGYADRQLVVALGPAGAGKTAALRALVEAATSEGRTVVGMAPSAVAAKVFAEETGAARSSTIDLALVKADKLGDQASGIEAGDLVVVDEAGMAGTHALATLNALCERRGAVLRLIGDDQQLSAVAAGGALRTIAHEVGAVRLTDLHRFDDPDEAAATLRVRDGDHGAIAFYEDSDRLHSGTRDELVDQLYADWRADRARDESSIMIAGDNATVTELSDRARTDLVAAGSVESEGVALRTGSVAGRGDLIVTRRNDRTLKTGRTDFVKNGDLWTVRKRHDDGSLTVKNQRHRGTVRLPATYVGSWVELGYATTVHRAQGMTVTTARTLVDATSMTREQFYVAMTRGRSQNQAYTVTDAMEPLHGDHQPERITTPREVLSQVLNRVDEAGRSASETIEVAFAEAVTLERLVPEYEHALGLAHAQQIDDAVDQVFGAENNLDAAVVREDPAYGALRARLGALLQEDGYDPLYVLQRAVDRHELATADSAAATLTWRIDQAVQRAAGGNDVDLRSPPGAPYDPLRRAGEDTFGLGLAEWLADQRDKITAREREVAHQAIARSPEWVDKLPPARDRDELVGAIARYRDRHGIRDNQHPLGHEPAPRSRQHVEWKRISTQLDEAAKSPTPEPAPARGEGTVAQKLRAQVDRRRGTDAEPERETGTSPAERLRQIAQGKSPEPSREPPAEHDYEPPAPEHDPGGGIER